MARDRAATIAPGHALQAPVSFESQDFSSSSDLDGRNLLDAANQVARHSRGETVGADQDVYSPAGPGAKYRRLTGGGGTSDDDHLLVVRELRLFHERGAVINSGALELSEIGERRSTVAGSRGENDRPTADDGAVAQPHTV